MRQVDVQSRLDIPCASFLAFLAVPFQTFLKKNFCFSFFAPDFIFIDSPLLIGFLQLSLHLIFIIMQKEELYKLFFAQEVISRNLTLGYNNNN